MGKESSPPPTIRVSYRYGYGCATLALLLAAGCGQEMANQRRIEPQEAAPMFADGVASRPLPEHVVPATDSAVSSRASVPAGARRPWLQPPYAGNTAGYFSGKSDGSLVDAIPDQAIGTKGFEALIRRGQERFGVSCVPCHGLAGDGNGMVARRGLKFPPSYHSDRLRNEPLGYIFNVISHGRGQMPAYGDFLSIDDRWAITAYVRTLQFSQYAPKEDLEDGDLAELERSQSAGQR